VLLQEIDLQREVVPHRRQVRRAQVRVNQRTPRGFDDPRRRAGRLDRVVRASAHLERQRAHVLRLRFPFVVHHEPQDRQRRVEFLERRVGLAATDERFAPDRQHLGFAATVLRRLERRQRARQQIDRAVGLVHGLQHAPVREQRARGQRGVLRSFVGRQRSLDRFLGAHAIAGVEERRRHHLQRARDAPRLVDPLRQRHRPLQRRHRLVVGRILIGHRCSPSA
jgi:hypothetical protein